jgi:hypothetical protein
MGGNYVARKKGLHGENPFFYVAEEEWAGARELVDSSYQPTYVVLEGHNPIYVARKEGK